MVNTITPLYHGQEVRNDTVKTPIEVPYLSLRSMIVNNNTDQRCIVGDFYSDLYIVDPYTIRASPMYPVSNQYFARMEYPVNEGHCQVFFTEQIQAYVFGLSGPNRVTEAFTLTPAVTSKSFTLRRKTQQIVIDIVNLTGTGFNQWGTFTVQYVLRGQTLPVYLIYGTSLFYQSYVYPPIQFDIELPSGTTLILSLTNFAGAQLTLSGQLNY